jgi:hypothetical protein
MLLRKNEMAHQAKNGSKTTTLNQFQRKYNCINGFTGKTKSMGGTSNSVKMIKVNGKLVIPN